IYRANGDSEASEQLAQRFRAVPPHTEEEYLYKGFATMPFTPRESLALFKKAVDERGSSIAFGARAVCQIRLAFNEKDPHWIEEAMGDIVAGKRIMKDNPEILAESVIVHFSASVSYRQGKKGEESDKAMRIAEEDALALKDLAEVPVAVQV